ncbi:NAD(P)(+)--arginine ADP-ribosyltransferase 2-like [Colossoma macropomum]|uniref:NAD(P)(+)--arginine ADP-ribosyltransferase 2-like n=1 Tax=Colossoma macropomum TaxID=42526 RepID=UPI001864A291|nr:NAD(P)(+)--arginine ADP-ribosyltransferase 2-like [Colossoma macropomum]
MKMTVSVVTVLFLMMVSVSVRKSNGEVWPLDMADNSVDDSFEGCRKSMYDLVMKKYIGHEKQKTFGFADAWEKALNKSTKGSLGKNQSAAIYMYTQVKSQNQNCSYVVLNDACRNGKESYKSDTFKFYTLYFFLTDAIQQLKKQLSQRFWRVTSYRRTNVTFGKVAVNQKIRFGTFTSSSLLNNLTHFGEESCFKIKTRYGAKLKKYSAVPHEQEVLIPPYEVFHITAIKKRDQKNKLWCKVVYELKSAGKRSDLQCIKTKKKPPVWGLHH